MLENTKAYSGFAVDDLERARTFNGETLGLKTSVEYGLMTLHIAGDRATLVDAEQEGPYIAWFKDPAGNILSVLQEC